MAQRFCTLIVFPATFTEHECTELVKELNEKTKDGRPIADFTVSLDRFDDRHGIPVAYQLTYQP